MVTERLIPTDNIEAPRISRRQALFNSILANPDDDTLRLTYADCLEESEPVRVKCGCWGGSVHGTSAHICKRCDGTGHVLDASDADLAELIRTQIQLATLLPSEREVAAQTYWSGQLGPVPEWANRGSRLQARERELLAAHPEWLRILRMPCPGCGKRIEHAVARAIASAAPSVPVGVTGAPPCETCGGTGDLLQRDTDDGNPNVATRNPALCRGITLRVECRLDEVMQRRCSLCGSTVEEAGTRGGGCSRCDGGTVRDWQPTPWARAFWGACVERERCPWYRITGMTTYIANGIYYWGAWDWETPIPYRRVGIRVVGKTSPPGVISRIPPPVYNLLPDHKLSSDGASMKGFRSLQEAQEALEYAYYQWFYQHQQKGASQ